MGYFKRRLAVFLSMVMLLTTVFVAVPQEQVQAATTTTLYWSFGNTTNPLLVQKGASNVYMGDYITASAFGDAYKYYGYLSNNSGVKYKSSNTSVASIHSTTGKLSAKKTGTTKITVTFKGQKATCTVKVVSSVKKYKPQWTYKSTKYASSFISAMGSKVTTSNRYKALAIYKKAGGFYDSGLYSSYDYNTQKSTLALYNPTAGHARALVSKLDSYGTARNPFSTYSSKMFNVTKMSGSNKTITATLSKKVTADYIFGVQYEFSWDSKVSDASKVSFPIYVVDTTDGHKYYAVASIKKNSQTMTIETKNLKLKKGRKYELEDYRGNAWLSGSKVISFKAQ